jgi:hypothetical protein
MEFRAIVHEEAGRLWAEVPDLPGCFASGRDEGELREAVAEAIDMCLSPWQKLTLRVQRAKPRVTYQRTALTA